MDNLSSFVQRALELGAYKIILSGKRRKDQAYRKICFSLLLNEKTFFIERFTEKQVFHSRVDQINASDEIINAFNDFTQINAWSQSKEFTAKLSKKGKLMCGEHPISTPPDVSSDQNRKKNYLIAEGVVIQPLVDMGVMTSDGKIKKQMFDKYKQINRFLEFIDDCIKDYDFLSHSSEDKFTIIDFGCGKSYLTFIIYYYFTEIKKIPIRLIGIDLKEDVIDFCSKLASKYGYDDIEFIFGDIRDYKADCKPDMIISLHACDTATDYALFNGITRGVKYILSVPCCQHELNKNADFGQMPIFDDDGILRERACSLITDGIRAKLLTACGYKTQLMEFVDLTHTPKNILIRAKLGELSADTKKAALETALNTLKLMNCQQTLYCLLKENGNI